MTGGLLVAGPAPCNRACPAGVNAQAYVSLAAQGRFREALEVVRERMPFAGICGRICTAPCEVACARRERDGALAIRALKRFLADLEPAPAHAVAPVTRAERVAVVGSGPAGLTCALDLRRLGYAVTVYEGEAEPGGMLARCIPIYRLPRETVRAEIEAIFAAGVELRAGVRVGRDVALPDLLGSGFAAAFLAVGAQAGSPLGVPGGEGAAGVVDALAYLTGGDWARRAAARVLVVGGGSTAMDAARTALRAGAEEVRVVYRRTRAEMPAAPGEVGAAIEEGVILETLLQPVRVVAEGGRVAALECVRTRLGEPDASGRPRPVPIPGSERRIAADLIVAAIGQSVEADVCAGLEGLVGRGRVIADPESLRTADARVFAGGDAVLGAATLVEAVGHGHRAAAAIHRSLRCGAARPPAAAAAPDPAATLYENPLDGLDLRARVPLPHLAVEARRRTFDEVEARLSEAEALAEARRCLRCGSCAECRLCVPSCAWRLVAVRPPAADGVLALGRAAAALALEASAAPAWEPIVPRVRPELCRACGRCVEVCAYGAPALGAAPGGGPVARIDPAFCRGCGICVAECPSAALDAGPLEGDRLRRLVRDLVEGAGRAAGAPPLLVLRCQWPEAEPPEVPEGPLATLRLPCAGRVDAGLVLEALLAGARGVAVFTCAGGACKYGGAAAALRERLRAAEELVGLCGAGPGALRLADGRGGGR